MINLLEGAEFGGTSINEQQANQLVEQGPPAARKGEQPGPLLETRPYLRRVGEARWLTVARRRRT